MKNVKERVMDDLIAGLPAGSVLNVAAELGLTIRFAKWCPVTAGEISHVRSEIVVNQNADVPFEQIVAHEIGHFIVRQKQITTVNEEAFCDRFAERLIAVRTTDK